MMGKKCFFQLCLVREERIWNNVDFIWSHVLEKSCFGHMFWRNHELWIHFVGISWNIFNYNICWFELWTCCMVQREPIIWWAGGRGCCLLSLLLLSLSNIHLLLPSPPRETLSINDCPRKWCSSSSAMIGNVSGRNPNCKIFFKILELLCILTKPKFFSNKLTRTHVAILTHWHFVQFA